MNSRATMDLHEAVDYREIDLIKDILAGQQALANSRNPEGLTPLHILSKEMFRRRSRLRPLAAYDPLHQVSAGGNEYDNKHRKQIFDLLVAHGADPTAM